MRPRDVRSRWAMESCRLVTHALDLAAATARSPPTPRTACRTRNSRLRERRVPLCCLASAVAMTQAACKTADPVVCGLNVADRGGAGGVRVGGGDRCDDRVVAGLRDAAGAGGGGGGREDLPQLDLGGDLRGGEAAGAGEVGGQDMEAGGRPAGGRGGRRGGP